MTITAMSLADAEGTEIGPGCVIRNLPGPTTVRMWVVEIAPGSQWPHVDHHPGGEQVYVLSGELIEGKRRFPAGTYLWYPPGSSHRPRTETGVVLLGANPVIGSAGETPR